MMISSYNYKFVTIEFGYIKIIFQFNKYRKIDEVYYYNIIK